MMKAILVAVSVVSLALIATHWPEQSLNALIGAFIVLAVFVMYMTRGKNS